MSLEGQANRQDGLRVRQQREGLSVQETGTNEDFHVIAKEYTCFAVRLASSRRTDFALRRVLATVVIASPAGCSTITDASSAKAHKPSPGLDGVNDLAVVVLVYPRVATAYM